MAFIGLAATITMSLTPAAQEGDNALKLGEYATAEKIFRDGISTFSVSGPDAAKALAQLHLGLGESLLWEAKIADANKELIRTLPQVEKAFGGQSAEYAHALDCVSWLYQALGKPDKTDAYCRQALDIRRKVLPANDPRLAESLEHLGQIDQNKGFYDEAAKCYEEALNIRKVSSGPWSIPVANDLEELAACNQRRGKNEDVSAMLAGALQLKERTNSVFKPFTKEPVEETVIYRFLPGAANCSQDFSGGSLVERITANGVTIVASIDKKPSQFIKMLRASVGVQNGGKQPINILPQSPTMILLAPTVGILHPMNPEEVAAQIQKKGESKAKWIKFWGADATTSVTSTAITNSNFPPYYIPPQYGYMPQQYGYSNNYWRNRNNSAMTTVTTQVPDWEARARAMQKASEAIDKSTTDAQDTKDNALGPMTVPPGQQVYGNLDFDDSKFTKALLRVPVGDAVFEFAFDR
jgi:hypothetical protein